MKCLLGHYRFTIIIVVVDVFNVHTYCMVYTFTKFLPCNLQIPTMQKASGFTLIELSIVIVIIGLIVGGIILGKDLILSASIRGQVSQIQKFQVAEKTFRLKYDALPGDSNQAASNDYSVNSAGTINSCYASSGPSINGNGNGVLETYAADSVLRFSGELVNYWIHLGNSNLIEALPGLSAGGCQTTHFAGTSYPRAVIGEGIIAVSSAQIVYYVLGGFGSSHGYDFSFASEGNASNIAGDKLTPTEAYSIDQKIDDGNPTAGDIKVIVSYLYPGPSGVQPFVGTLTTDSADNTNNCVYNATYNFGKNTQLCTLAIKGK